MLTHRPRCHWSSQRRESDLRIGKDQGEKEIHSTFRINPPIEKDSHSHKQIQRPSLRSRIPNRYTLLCFNPLSSLRFVSGFNTCVVFGERTASFADHPRLIPCPRPPALANSE